MEGRRIRRVHPRLGNPSNNETQHQPSRPCSYKTLCQRLQRAVPRDEAELRRKAAEQHCVKTVQPVRHVSLAEQLAQAAVMMKSMMPAIRQIAPLCAQTGPFLAEAARRFPVSISSLQIEEIDKISSPNTDLRKSLDVSVLLSQAAAR